MRVSVPSAVLCCSLLALRAVFAAPNADPGSAAAGAAGAGSPAPAAAPANDAAARHAKRTACIKTAKAKKLLGAGKTAFIKDCLAAP